MVSISRVIASIFWTPLGLILWLPLMVRFFALQAIALTVSAIAGEKLVDDNKEKGQQVLLFFLNGFKIIWAPYDRRSTKEESTTESLFQRIVDSLIASLFIYLPIFFVFRRLGVVFH